MRTPKIYPWICHWIFQFSAVRLVFLAALLSASAGPLAFAEEPVPNQPAAAATPAQPQAGSGLPPVAVLPTTDASQLNLAGPLQYALAQIYQQTREFDVKLSSYALNGFTEAHLKKAYAANGATLLSFCYMEKERVSLFLFNPALPKHFFSASQSIIEPGKPVTNELIEERFRRAFADLMAAYKGGQQQLLPGASVDSDSLANAEDAEARRRAAEAKNLFRELTSLQEKFYYLGTHIGMARFKDDIQAASTVNFGLMAGLKLSTDFRVEAGIDFFSYATAQVGARYVLPFDQKYVTLSVGLGGCQVLSQLTANRGFTGSSLPSGKTLFGPGIGFDIPLLGANIRGDIRYYMGSATILFGTYGIVYSI